MTELRRCLSVASVCCATLVACSAKDDDAGTGSDGSTASTSAALSSTGTASTTAGPGTATQTAAETQSASTTSTTTGAASTATNTVSTTVTASTTVTTTTATATATGTGGAAATTSASITETSGGGSGGTTGGSDPLTFAAGLDGLFIDAPCQEPTPTPLPEEATCDHPASTQRIEENVVFGGDPATTYSVTLRVRGIWEPTFISGGEAPDADLPFKIGGEVGAGNAIDYQQFFITVSDPAETYWLNDYQYTAHDIHKADYEIVIPVVGGAMVTVVRNDGNERQIANYPGELFEDLPPYDQEPTKGQLLHLDVVSVNAQ